MTTTLKFPISRPLQTGSMLTQQTTTQQATGLNFSALMNLILPALIVGTMAKMMSVTTAKKKQVIPATESTTSHPKKTKKSG
jgi:hypothetical protein